MRSKGDFIYGSKGKAALSAYLHTLAVLKPPTPPLARGRRPG